MTLLNDKEDHSGKDTRSSSSMVISVYLRRCSNASPFLATLNKSLSHGSSCCPGQRNRWNWTLYSKYSHVDGPDFSYKKSSGNASLMKTAEPGLGIVRSLCRLAQRMWMGAKGLTWHSIPGWQPWLAMPLHCRQRTRPAWHAAGQQA